MSTRTDGNNACVAVQMAGNVVGVCDSKAGHSGAVLAFKAPQWRRFTRAVQLGGIVPEPAVG
jgi:hypothetical protein